MADGVPNLPTDKAGDDYDRKFNKSGKASQELNDRENNAVNDKLAVKNNLKDKEATGTVIKKPKVGKKPGRPRLRGMLRDKSALVFIVFTLITGVFYSSVFAPSIILVNIKDLFSDDLSDATTALAKYATVMIDHKLGGEDCGEKDTIKCKLSTMSRGQKLTLEKHGFKVNGEKVEEDNRDDKDPANDKPFESRFKVSSVEFPEDAGSASSGDQFVKLANSSEKVRYLTDGAWNPKSSWFQDVRFRQRLKSQFDLTLGLTTSGDTVKETLEAFDDSMQGPNEAIDDAGQGAYGLKTLSEPSSVAQFSKIGVKIAARSFSYVDNQCAYWTMGKVVYNAMAKAKQVTIARFASQYLKAADSIKSGRGNDEMIINALASNLTQSVEGGFESANATDAAIYRHIVMGEPFRESGNGMTYYNNNFETIGVLQPAWQQQQQLSRAVAGIAGLRGQLGMPPTDTVPATTEQYCWAGQTDQNKANLKPQQCPALTTRGSPSALQGAVQQYAQQSSRICPPPDQGYWMMTPTSVPTVQTVMPFFSNLFGGLAMGWATQTAKNFTSKTTGTPASDAIFAGTGIILGDMAMSRGMRPADTQSLTEYLREKTAFQQDTAKAARYAARQDPFNIYNRYSFLGSITHSLLIPPSQQTTLFSSLTNLLSIIPSALRAGDPSASALYYLQPDKFNPARLTCPDAEYLKIGITADAGCNVRYSMSADDLDPDIDSVLDYMLEEHSDEYDDDLQDLRARLNGGQLSDGQNITPVDMGDDPQDRAAVTRMLQEAQEASNKPFIDEKTGKPTPHSQFEKFMDYCVNRQDLWGRKALAVHREGLSEDEKQARYERTFSTGDALSGEEYETRIATQYLAVDEGSLGDQDWYSGEKCLEEDEMMHNFRAYTMACSVDGSFAGAPDCTERDHGSFPYGDDFFTSNDIFFQSWWH